MGIMRIWFHGDIAGEQWDIGQSFERVADGGGGRVALLDSLTDGIFNSHQGIQTIVGIDIRFYAMLLFEVSVELGVFEANSRRRRL